MIHLTKKDRDFETLSFAASGRETSKTEKRQHVTHVFLKDGLAYGCDGKWLFVGETSRKETGWFQVLKDTKTELVMVPVPADSDFNIEMIEDNCLTGVDKPTPKTRRHKFSMSLPEPAFSTSARGKLESSICCYKLAKADRCVDIDRLSALFSREQNFSVFIPDGPGPVLFWNRNKRAYIMPIDTNGE
jgi:hypothetical protein